MSGLLSDFPGKGESDVSVAAPSILARERFINWMDEASARLGLPLPRGTTHVKAQAAQVLAARGTEFLGKVWRKPGT